MVSREEKKEILSNIIANETKQLICKIYIYPNIPDKVKSRIIKEYDPYININSVVGIVDTSLFGDLKDGMAFTLSGLYYKGTFEKPVYVKYTDIDELYVIPDKKGRTDANATMDIKLKDGRKIHLSFGDADKSILCSILKNIKDETKDWDDFSKKESGAVDELALTDEDKKKCHAIIHSASASAGAVGTGLAQIPLADNAIITPIQIAMITALGAVFDIRISEGAAKAIIGSMTASMIGRGITQVVFGWFPGIGNAINTATAAGITEAIGWAAVKHFFNAKNDDRAKHRIDGMESGYEMASDEYEEKLRKQAEVFIKQMNYAKDQEENYKRIINEYEKHIEMMKRQIEILEKANGLDVPETLKTSYSEMTSELVVLRGLEECS